MNYDSNILPIDVAITSHLIETNRVCDENFSNFHILYYLALGAPDDMKKELHLECQSFRVSKIKLGTLYLKRIQMENIIFT